MQKLYNDILTFFWLNMWQSPSMEVLRSYLVQAFQLCSPSHGVVYSTFTTHMEWYHWRYCELLPITAKGRNKSVHDSYSETKLVSFLSINRPFLYLWSTRWLHLQNRSHLLTVHMFMYTYTVKASAFTNCGIFSVCWEIYYILQKCHMTG